MADLQGRGTAHVRSPSSAVRRLVEAGNIDGRRVDIDIAGTRLAARLQIAPAFDPARNHTKY